MAAMALKRDHHIRKLGMGCLSAIAAMSDLPILAENAEQVAIREENCPRTAAPYERSFFTEMRPEGSNLESLTGAADAHPSCHAVDAAQTRTESTVFHHFPERTLTAFKFAAGFKAKITRPVPVSGLGSPCRISIL
jgi:hypothetical protein